jgi:hypothetical protein
MPTPYVPTGSCEINNPVLLLVSFLCSSHSGSLFCCFLSLHIFYQTAGHMPSKLFARRYGRVAPIDFCLILQLATLLIYGMQWSLKDAIMTIHSLLLFKGNQPTVYTSQSLSS